MGRRRVLVDLGPLRTSADFRRLWATSAVSSIGSQMTRLAVVLQVFTLTHSSAAVGAVGLATAVPGIVFGLASGAVVDSVDRRRLVIGTSLGLAAVSAALAAQAFADLGQVWLLYLLVAVQSLLSVLSGPARRTFLPRLLPPEQVPAGAALNVLVFHVSLTAGPALAGVLTAAAGLRTCYLVDAISFAAALYGVFRLPAMPPVGGGTRPSLRAVGEGLRFIRGNPVLVGALLTDLNSTVLAMPFALFPAINAERFGGSPQTLGLLVAAPAVGGIVGSTLSGPVGQVARQGRAMVVASAVWGAALAGFGLAHGRWLTLGMLGLAGVADVVAVVFRTSILQVATPDRYRGRVSATEWIVGAACPDAGNFRAGAVAALTSPAVSAVSGGLAAVAGAAVISLTLPSFTRYGRRPDAGPDLATGPETAGQPS